MLKLIGAILSFLLKFMLICTFAIFIAAIVFIIIWLF